MKKNLMSVLILALVLVNLILTGILTITILPQTKKSNELVNKVCSAIDLELESGDGTESASIPMDQVETYKIVGSLEPYQMATFASGSGAKVSITGYRRRASLVAFSNVASEIFFATYWNWFSSFWSSPRVYSRSIHGSLSTD